jgi:uncharacterized PurR-regulated membrane protein YhhQ (DUF165 family)
MSMLRTPLILPIAAMAVIVALSNFAVQFPFRHFGLADYLTWGAFTYPFAFLVNDLTNRRFGSAAARQVVFVGFVAAVLLSMLLATPRIAAASGTAFLAAQLLDVSVFDRLRRAAWWKAPFISSVIGSAVDTAIFFSLAFAGTPLPWISWGIVDFFVKLGFAAALVVPYWYARRIVPAYEEASGRA